jgi:hypothetical protein
MLLKILLGLAAAFALLWTIKTRKLYPAIITVGLIVGIILTLFQARAVQFPGIHVYLGFVMLSFIYGLIVKEKDLKARIIICLMSASIFVYWLWVLNHWHGNEMLAPLLVLVAGTAGIVTKAKLRDEAGFLLILLADAIAIVIEHLLKVS